MTAIPGGWFNFQPGILTAAQVRNFLMAQVITVHDDATARDAAITDPQEGMFAFLRDTDELTQYDGAAWVEFGAAPEQAFTRVASNTTEQDTTSTSAVDVVSFSGLDIPPEKTVKISITFRKSDGAGARFEGGLKINDVIVVQPGGNYVFRTSATNQAENGSCEITIPPRATNYQAGLYAMGGSKSAAGALADPNGNMVIGAVSSLSALVPVAPITDIAIRGLVGSASITGYIKDVRVYVLD